MSQKLFVSADEVAKRAGVSRSAVSRAFTPGASVSASTRQKVVQAAEELGYHVNHLARGLMRNESGIVCLIVSDVATPYRSALLRELTQQLQLAGKVAMLVNTDRSDGSVDRALQQAIRYRADASIIMSGLPDKSIAQLCLRSGQRLVLINRDDDQPGPLRINLDDTEAAQRVVTAFVRAGCRRLAFANSDAGTPSLMARETGFVAAAKAQGLDVTVERYGLTGYESGKVLAQRLLTKSERPDAVFCATDLLACGFMDAARHQFSISVPESLSIVGFDDIEQASWSSYELTTFAQPVMAIASEAVQWLSAEPSGDPDQTSKRLHAEFVWRGSVRAG
ncbi:MULTISPECIES: LacI family DNA-binding transcriptional regulator [Rhizobium]|uniref:LacI family DNA-binding transcriptional regulator n=1 Tax=Rhizobium rhododendri TaxID=2506430 RepID=A0ABY8ISC1_9HYPH|nr:MULTISPECIES: LacI family DNA-binding transcriptional regulator [Rhizobium]QXZ81440.1 LacI family DNA-binding transcriptional regulator [Rhizobium sp. L51/94]QYA04645.1 LacI family DNA-binding transcriptional regulator [Rhizobium sp. B21/90]TQX85972.1 LacI family DNA-binding transcriptional regulator [Rhizobium sp. rho-13.1]TQY11028.1 LacI family DNA-binding transcriptional regulator [Rhizobium sp. rho-1.1]WFS26092.1 LacI family DNA-binding transcriptional regulator [Rhizobium rhododendri]